MSSCPLLFTAITMKGVICLGLPKSALWEDSLRGNKGENVNCRGVSKLVFYTQSEFRSCVKVEVAVLGSPS